MKRRVWLMVIAALLVGVFPMQAKAVDLNVAGKSALLMDAATGTILYEHNAHEPLAPASVTKVMTMLLIKADSDPARCSAIAQAQSLAEETAMDLTISETVMVSPTFK